MQLYLENGQSYCNSTGPTILQEDRCSLHVPPSPYLGGGGYMSYLYSPCSIRSRNLENDSNLPV